MYGMRIGTIAAVLLLAACGGGEPPPATPTTPPAEGPTGDAPPGTASSSPSAVTAGSAPAGGGAAAPTPTDGPWPLGPAPTAEERAAQLDRLRKDPGPIKSNWVPPGKTDRYGHAEGIVAAPPDAVRARLVDFPHFSELAGPKFKSVKVVDKQGQASDVYFQLPIMKGLVTIWYITRFPPARLGTSGDVVEGTFVKGNIKGMHIALTLRPGPDDKSSIVVCDLVLQPNVPAPQSALDEELRDACGDAIHSLRRTLVK